MNKLWQLLNKKLSMQTNVSIILAAIILYWMFNRFALEFYIALVAPLIASACMLIYLTVSWRRLTKNDRVSIEVSVIGWWLLAYGVLHSDGLTITSLLWWR